MLSYPTLPISKLYCFHDDTVTATVEPIPVSQEKCIHIWSPQKTSHPNPITYSTGPSPTQHEHGMCSCTVQYRTVQSSPVPLLFFFPCGLMEKLFGPPMPIHNNKNKYTRADRQKQPKLLHNHRQANLSDENFSPAPAACRPHSRQGYLSLRSQTSQGVGSGYCG